MSLPTNPRAVVTGGGSGLGRALCLALAQRGARVLVSDCDLASAEETARLARDAGATFAQAERCDVTRVEDIEALAGAAESAFGGVDLLVNNAGVGSGGMTGEIPLDDWRWTLAVDLWGVVYGCHVFVPRMKKQGSGHILNIASAAGLLSAPRMGPYNVAKAGVVALSETLSAELVEDRIGVTVCCPTFFKTNIVSSGRFTGAKLREQAEKLLARGTLTAEDVARVTLAAVDKKQLYVVPMADGRWFWRLKRIAPGSFAKLASKLERRVVGRA